VAFGFTLDALTEIQRHFTEKHKVIVTFTVKKILEVDVAKKLA